MLYRVNMDITYFGHSSFRIKGKKASLVTDPFDKNSVGFKYPSNIKADIVTISHDHDDHNNRSAVKGEPKVLNGPGEYEVKGISVIGLPSYHDDKKGEERGKNTIYIIEVDEYRIVHLGDLGHKLSDSMIGQIGDVDVLLVPVGGVYTIDSKAASELVKSVEPKIAIPMHYKTKKHNPKVFSELTDEKPFLAEVGLMVENEKKLTLNTILSEEDQKVVLLDPKT